MIKQLYKQYFQKFDSSLAEGQMMDLIQELECNCYYL